MATIASLRERGPRLSLAALIEAATTETGYDLAVLMRPAGEARFANVRKLMRLAAEFESREGRDLRGLLDFLAARAESDAEAQAATAAEGHDGVRIMTVHNAKGLEFDVVAVPDLSRSLLAGARPPLLTLGREQPPRVGMQLRRLGSGAINLFDYAELCEEAKERDAEEGLRLFHVAATRARERLILSGVVKPEPGRETKPSTPVVERLVEALGVERDADAGVVVPAPEPRLGLDATFGPSEIAVRRQPPLARARRASCERRAARPPPTARSARARRRWSSAGRRSSPAAPSPTPRSPPTKSAPTASTWSGCWVSAAANALLPAYRATSDDRGQSRRRRWRPRRAKSGPRRAPPCTRCWSGARRTGGASPRRSWRAATRSPPGSTRSGPTRRRCWHPCAAGSARALRERIGAGARRGCRAEVPILLGVGDTVLRGSIDLLVEREGEPPLVVDYKTDRLGGSGPAEHAARYETQRTIYALAVAESLGAAEVEVAYVFLERPEEPALTALGPAEMEAGRERLDARHRPASAAASSRSPRSRSATGPSAAAAQRWAASARAPRA